MPFDPPQPTAASCPDRKNRHAFTLLELLVVVAIIALLAAILFPVFVRVRENARRTTCQSNMKQLGLAAIQYLQDNDETMCPTLLGPLDYVASPYSIQNATNCSQNAYKWMDAFYPYVRNEQVYTCPDAVHLTPDRMGETYSYCDSTSLAIDQFGKNEVGSYAANDLYGDNLRGENLTPFADSLPTRATTYTSPSETILISEGNGDTQGDQNYDLDSYINNAYTICGVNTNPVALCSANAPLLVQRHLDTTNLLYEDGHVKAGLLSELMAVSVQVKATSGTYYMAFKPFVNH